MSKYISVPHSRFNIIHEIVEGDKRQLGFEMRVFAQMAAGVTWVMVSTRDLGMRNKLFHLFSALKLSWTQNTSPSEGRQVSRYSCEL